MTGLAPEGLRATWSRTWRDLWRPLLTTPRVSEDLVIELVREVARETKPTAPGAAARNGVYLTTAALNRMDLNEDLSSVRAASRVFKSLKSPDFRNCRAPRQYLEAVVEVLEEFDDAASMKQRYIDLAARFVRRYNLAYRLGRNPFRLTPLLPDCVRGVYAALEERAADDEHLAEALDGFAFAWAEMVEAEGDVDLKAPLARATILAEAFVAAQLGEPDDLGRMVDRMRHQGAFPHAALAAAIRNVYGFCSDYPHIRHGNNPNGKLRELEPRDAMLASLVLIAFTSYAIE
jgi:hypothetical protein